MTHKIINIIIKKIFKTFKILNNEKSVKKKYYEQMWKAHPYVPKTTYLTLYIRITDYNIYIGTLFGYK